MKTLLKAMRILWATFRGIAQSQPAAAEKPLTPLMRILGLLFLIGLVWAAAPVEYSFWPGYAGLQLQLRQ